MDRKNIEYSIGCGVHISKAVNDMCSMIADRNDLESVSSEFNGVKITVTRDNYQNPDGIVDWFVNEMDSHQIDYYASEAGLRSLQDSAMRTYEAQTRANDHLSSALGSTEQRDFAVCLIRMAEFTDHTNVKCENELILKKMRFLGCKTDYEFGKKPETVDDMLEYFFTNVKSMFEKNMPIHPVMANQVLEFFLKNWS